MHLAKSRISQAGTWEHESSLERPMLDPLVCLLSGAYADGISGLRYLCIFCLELFRFVFALLNAASLRT